MFFLGMAIGIIFGFFGGVMVVSLHSSNWGEKEK